MRFNYCFAKFNLKKEKKKKELLYIAQVEYVFIKSVATLDQF